MTKMTSRHLPVEVLWGYPTGCQPKDRLRRGGDFSSSISGRSQEELEDAVEEKATGAVENQWMDLTFCCMSLISDLVSALLILTHISLFHLLSLYSIY